MNGKPHARWGWAFVGATVLAAPYLAELDPQIAAGAIAGSVLGILLSPDLDHEYRTYDQLRVYRYLGKRAGRFYEWFWRAYERKYKHRGISHHPIRGTFTRWRYVALRLFPLLILAAPWIADHALVVLAAFAFHCLQDLLHLACDGWKYYD